MPPSTKRLLDLGCAAGGLATLLPGVEVVGVELDEEYAAAAERHCARVVRADVEELARDELEASSGASTAWSPPTCSSTSSTPGAPCAPTRGCWSRAAPRSISLPNVAHWSTYAALIRGSWPRNPEGIHDATHLRWFTLRDARELVEQAGLAVATVDRRPRLIWRGSRLDDLLGPLALRIPAVRTLVTFQHVLTAYPARA